MKSKLHILLWKQLKYSIRLKILLFNIIWLLPESWRKKDLIWKSLDQVSKKNKTVIFINIGANDGLSGDPLIEFIFKYKWKGLLIEPLPYVFERLKRVYSGQKQVHCINVAIAEQSGIKQFYYLKDSKSLPPGSDQIGSFNKDHLLKHEYMFPNLKKYLTSMPIECLTLRDLKKRYHLDHIDVYLIDTEGYDFEVLKLIDFSQNKPELVIFEHQHLSKEDGQASQQLLTTHGYTIQSEGGNTIASLLG